MEIASFDDFDEVFQKKNHREFALRISKFAAGQTVSKLTSIKSSIKVNFVCHRHLYPDA